MTNNSQATGRLLQDYVRAKWKKNSEADEIGRRLDPSLRSRVDFLGVDDERLLEVEADAVLETIEELERNAVLEDAGAVEKAVRTLLNEERRGRPVDSNARLRWVRKGSIRKHTRGG